MAVKLYVLLYMHVYRIHNFSFYHLMMTDFPRFTLIMNVVGKMSNYIYQDSKIWNQKIYNYSHFLLFRDVRDLIQILKNSHNLIYLWIYPFTYSRKFNWFLVSCFRYWKKKSGRWHPRVSFSVKLCRVDFYFQFYFKWYHRNMLLWILLELRYQDMWR